MPGLARSLVFAVAVLSLVTACEKPSPGGPGRASQPTPVATVVVKSQQIQETLPALGTLLARESVAITSSVAEKVSQLHFDDGQTVEAGDLLATLEQAEERALLASAQADLAEQERELRRLKGLLATQSAAQTEYDQRLSNKQRAEARIREVEAMIAERTLRAPFDGIVGLRQVSPGALLSPGTVITTLDDLDTMRLDFQMPSLLLGKLQVGQSITARSEALGQEFEGRISAIDQRIDSQSRSVTARASLANADHLLKPGMLMHVQLKAEPRSGMMIPEQALESVDQEHFLWVIDSDGKAQRRQVTLGIRRAGKVEIHQGLSAGEQVITQGYMNLRPGSPVAAPTSPSSDPTPAEG